jgi:hypothetical protein
MFPGLIGVRTLGGFDWAITQSLRFSYCCELPWLGLAIVSNLLGLQM